MKELNEDWLKGYLYALESYAWWKDGVQYVGCGIRTLEEARETAIRVYGPDPTTPSPIK